ncbi:MAG: hypothetical protein K2X47_04825 [Bdellovibrionales bacterium]|nr:hypothetical protein [Bdellovibrionales bacterium]
MINETGLAAFSESGASDIVRFFGNLRLALTQDLLAAKWRIPNFEAVHGSVKNLGRIETHLFRMLINSELLSTVPKSNLSRMKYFFREILSLKMNLINMDIFIQNQFLLFLPHVDWLSLKESSRRIELNLQGTSDDARPSTSDLRIYRWIFAYNWMRRIYSLTLLSQFILKIWVVPVVGALGLEKTEPSVLEKTFLNSAYLSVIKVYGTVLGLRSNSAEIQYLIGKSINQHPVVFISEFGAAAIRDGFFIRFFAYVAEP